MKTTDTYREKLKITVRFAQAKDNPFEFCEKIHFKSWAKAWECVRENVEFPFYATFNDPKPVVVSCVNHVNDTTYNKREGWWFIDVYSDEAKKYKLENETLDFLKESFVKKCQKILGSK